MFLLTGILDLASMATKTPLALGILEPGWSLTKFSLPIAATHNSISSKKSPHHNFSRSKSLAIHLPSQNLSSCSVPPVLLLLARSLALSTSLPGNWARCRRFSKLLRTNVPQLLIKNKSSRDDNIAKNKLLHLLWQLHSNFVIVRRKLQDPKMGQLAGQPHPTPIFLIRRFQTCRIFILLPSSPSSLNFLMAFYAATPAFGQFKGTRSLSKIP